MHQNQQVSVFPPELAAARAASLSTCFIFDESSPNCFTGCCQTSQLGVKERREEQQSVSYVKLLLGSDMQLLTSAPFFCTSSQLKASAQRDNKSVFGGWLVYLNWFALLCLLKRKRQMSVCHIQVYFSPHCRYIIATSVLLNSQMLGVTYIENKHRIKKTTSINNSHK